MPENVVGVPLDAITGNQAVNDKKMYVYYYVKGSEYVNSEMEYEGNKENITE